MNLNHIFLFIAVISPLTVLARVWRPGGGEYRGWRIAAIVVLGITAVSWFLVRDVAGFIGGGVWFLLLFLPATGLRRVTELLGQHRYRSARRLATALRLLHPTKEVRQYIEVLRRLELQHGSYQSPVRVTSRSPCRPLKSAPAVLFFITVNILVFVVKLGRGGTDNANVLHQLGALDPYSVVIQHQYWRLVTSLFLHYNILHLVFNLFALYVLGPSLEEIIGTARFGACYLVSGLGSGSGVIVLNMMRWVHPGELVGASGCIMGIVGAWAGFLLRRHQAPRARQRLMNILTIVAIQTVFDLATPEVSLAAHICGLITGFLVGMLIAPKIAI